MSFAALSSVRSELVEPTAIAESTVGTNPSSENEAFVATGALTTPSQPTLPVTTVPAGITALTATVPEVPVSDTASVSATFVALK